MKRLQYQRQIQFSQKIRQKRTIVFIVVLFSFLCIILGENLLLQTIAKRNEGLIAQKKMEYFRTIPSGSDEKRFLYFLKKNPAYETYYKTIKAESKKFPIDRDYFRSISYEDSWGNERNFGGKRSHEGTDLMSNTNKRGEIPIFSMSDGVVENKGWLTLGGFRIGIKTKSGIYYYYAHLYSYAEGLNVGDEVKAGQFLGFMGDSGYGEEGTIGQFPVHLHMGIYMTMGQKEISVNPYWILKELEKKEKSNIAR